MHRGTPVCLASFRGGWRIGGLANAVPSAESNLLAPHSNSHTLVPINVFDAVIESSQSIVMVVVQVPCPASRGSASPSPLAFT